MALKPNNGGSDGVLRVKPPLAPRPDMTGPQKSEYSLALATRHLSTRRFISRRGGATGGVARSEAVRDSVAPCVGVVGDIPRADLLAPHGYIVVWRVRLRQIVNGVPQDLVFLPLRVESTVAVTRQRFSAARGIVRPRNQRLSMTKVIAAFLAVPMSR